MDEPEDEQFARKAYDKYLRDYSLAESISWQRGPEPPDYLLTANGMCYAVEVTTITAQYERESGPLQSEIGLVEKMRRLTAKIKDKTIANGSLHACYSFHLEGSHGTFDDCRDGIAEIILKFIQNDTDPNDIDMHEIGTVGEYSVHITKFNGRQSDLMFGFSPETSGCDNEFVTEVDYLIRRAIADKRHKLRKVSFPRILLLKDEYRLLDVELFSHCPIVNEGDDSFHSVYIITCNQRAHPLWETPFTA